MKSTKLLVIFALSLLINCPINAADSGLPLDPRIKLMPILKAKSEKPIQYSFTDFYTKKEVKTQDLLGKYVFVHGHNFVSQLKTEDLITLRTLYEKYSKKGFTIITINSFFYPENSPAAVTTRNNLNKMATDYGVSWNVFVPSKTRNLSAQFSSEQTFGWILNPEGKLVHSNVFITSVPGSANHDYIILSRALEAIFNK